MELACNFAYYCKSHFLYNKIPPFCSYEIEKQMYFYCDCVFHACEGFNSRPLSHVNILRSYQILNASEHAQTLLQFLYIVWKKASWADYFPPGSVLEKTPKTDLFNRKNGLTQTW